MTIGLNKATTVNPTGAFQEIIFTFSASYTPLFKQRALVYVIGGGGGGGAVYSTAN